MNASMELVDSRRATGGASTGGCLARSGLVSGVFGGGFGARTGSTGDGKWRIT